jgi:hypothetical protein
LLCVLAEGEASNGDNDEQNRADRLKPSDGTERKEDDYIGVDATFPDNPGESRSFSRRRVRVDSVRDRLKRDIPPVEVFKDFQQMER